ncbi:ROK family protein [Anaerolinea sp.]|uniref:ROK family protein n=1 Tax=Anaerolinea sp. TaxID=1872519 RepID=UPI002ACEB158|nr:ROK family protein [Anaerolinea sp.]
MSKLVGGIEAGGTKFICAVGSGPDDIRAEIRIPTTQPEETLGKVIAFFKEQQEKYREQLRSIGIACFGPIDLNPHSSTYGFITSTPKPGWKNTNVVGTIRKALNLPIAFEHDVVGAAIGEAAWGAAKGLSDFIYITIGTGIGGGILVNGKPIHGLVHPEVGHMRLPHDLKKDPFLGNCPYHGDCFEGLASGPALEKRWGMPGYQIPDDHPAWSLEAEYIALAVSNLILTTSPQKIILGGGVMQRSHLFPVIRQKVLGILNGYVQARALLDDIEHYIVPPGLGNRAGILGSLAMAQQIV